MSKFENLWSSYCVSNDIEGLIGVIGNELLIMENSTLSIQKIMTKLKNSFDSEFNETLLYTSKKGVQSEIRKGLHRMQKLGLVKIEQKIDSTRYLVDFLWLKEIQEACYEK